MAGLVNRLRKQPLQILLLEVIGIISCCLYYRNHFWMRHPFNPETAISRTISRNIFRADSCQNTIRGGWKVQPPIGIYFILQRQIGFLVASKNVKCTARNSICIQKWISRCGWQFGLPLKIGQHSKIHNLFKSTQMKTNFIPFHLKSFRSQKFHFIICF